MALFSKTFWPKIAKKDILCYKEIVFYHGNLVSVEYGKVFSDSVLDGEKFYRPDSKFTFPTKTFENLELEYKVEEGFVHAYKEKDVSECTLTCIIPKGTLYYEDDISFAARKLKVIKLEFSRETIINNLSLWSH